MAHVFTYGTLMFPEIWTNVASREFATVGGQVSGFAVYRVRDAVYPAMRSAEGGSVRGVVYLDVNDDALARLDRFEGVAYERRPIQVRCDDDQARTAEAYIIAAGELGMLTNEPWLAEEFVARGDLARFVAGYAGFERIQNRG